MAYAPSGPGPGSGSGQAPGTKNSSRMPSGSVITMLRLAGVLICSRTGTLCAASRSCASASSSSPSCRPK